MGQLEENFFDLLVNEMAFDVNKPKFGWLVNKVDRSETALWSIFEALGGNSETMLAKKSTRLSPDGFLPNFNCIIEFDELQHFTAFRLTSLLHYPSEVRLGFDANRYKSYCKKYAENALK